jgi:hypothetical protein
MTTRLVTKETGGRARMTPMTVVEPEQQLTHGSFDTVATDITGDKVFLAGLLSAVCATARGSVQLYRALAARTGVDVWRDRFEAFGREAEDQVRIIEDLIGRLHGDRQYVSPAARLEEARVAKLMEVAQLSGCADVRLQELTDLEAVIAVAQKGHANGELLRKLADQLPPGDTRIALLEATSQLGETQDEHLRWATETWQEAVIQTCLTP